MGQLMTGGVATTATEKRGQLARLPALSTAEQLTVVVPRLNVLPETGLQDDDAMPELSTALNVHDATAVGVFPLVGETMRGDIVLNEGQVRVGRLLSVLWIENEQMEILLALSDAEQPTMTRPIGTFTGLLTLHD